MMTTQVATPTKNETEIVARQRAFFETGQTKDIYFRIAQLKRLKQVIQENQGAITAALAADLRKPEFEAVASEIAYCLETIDYVLKNIKAWVKPKRVKTPFIQLPGKAQIIYEPLGVVLIIGPWNYPFQLVIAPLVGAIAAGNCSILKPSEVAENTSKVLADIIGKSFDAGFIAVVEGGQDTTTALLKEKFDHIFFTGGTEVGKIIMAAAAKQLTPVTLELGGKSPCIVDADVDLKIAARRIAWGKFLNAGQTCIAPDYLLVQRRVKEQLLAEIKECVQEFYGDDPASSPDYARIASDKHFNRLCNLLKDGEVIFGGETNPAERYIAPTLIQGVDKDDAVMQSEIFGPILPVVEYDELKGAIAFINARSKPLAVYIFSKNPAIQQQVLQETSSGGVCINDTIMQLSPPELPFGGVGDSGIGRYHGKASFDTFSNQKSVFNKSLFPDIKLRYPPYKDKLELIKWLFR